MNFSKAPGKYEFLENYQSDDLAVSLIGMSGIGKSLWSQRLARELGFQYFGCDDMIGARLQTELLAIGHKSEGTDAVADWMGQPYDARFPVTQARYLELENEETWSILDKINDRSKNVVVDTTGSIVYTEPQIQRRLSAATTVVYIEASPKKVAERFAIFIAEPKPVVWGEVFSQAAGETTHEALARSYPDLLAYRSGLYKDLAHVVMPFEAALELPDASAFIEYVADRLAV